MAPLSPDSRIAEQAALYACGALPPDECAAFESELANRESAAALAAMAPVIEALADAIPEVTPPDNVRASLVDRIGKEAAANGTSKDPYVQLSADADWRETGVPGVTMRQLYADRERRIRSILFRLEPGSTAPAHFHPGPEECLILEGDLHTLGKVFRAGDYFRAPAGSYHEGLYSEGGCLCLIISAA